MISYEGPVGQFVKWLVRNMTGVRFLKRAVEIFPLPLSEWLWSQSALLFSGCGDKCYKKNALNSALYHQNIFMLRYIWVGKHTFTGLFCLQVGSAPKFVDMFIISHHIELCFSIHNASSLTSIKSNLCFVFSMEMNDCKNSNVICCNCWKKSWNMDSEGQWTFGFHGREGISWLAEWWLVGYWGLWLLFRGSNFIVTGLSQMYLMCPVSITNSLTPRSRIFLEKLTVTQVVKKLPAFYGTWRFIIVFTREYVWVYYKVMQATGRLQTRPWKCMFQHMDKATQKEYNRLELGGRLMTSGE